jgi:hypothetical protein
VPRQDFDFMALATLSNEQKIRDRLKQLGCGENSFVVFNGVVGRTRFFEAMSGKPGTQFKPEDAERLSRVIDEMKEIQSELQNRLGNESNLIAIDWTRTERIATALTTRRVAKYAVELGDHSLDGFAERATEFVKS